MLPPTMLRLTPLMQKALSRLFDAFDFMGRQLGGEMLLPPFASGVDMEQARGSLRYGVDALPAHRSAP